MTSLLKRYLVQNSRRLVVIALWILILAYLARHLPAELPLAALFLLIYAVSIYGLLQYSSQTVMEAVLLLSMMRLRKSIDARIKGKTTPTKLQLQPKFELLRRSMRGFVAVSSAVFPPVKDYAFEKLRKAIDVFFYSAGAVVFAEKPGYYSSSEERAAEFELESVDPIDEWQDQEDRYHEAAQDYEDSRTGHVSKFGIYDLKGFVDYLANRLFRAGDVHSIWTVNYAINLVDFQKFFEHWNTILEKSENGSTAIKAAMAEVDQFYTESRKQEETRSQRLWDLASKLLVSILSLVLGYVLGRI